MTPAEIRIQLLPLLRVEARPFDNDPERIAGRLNEVCAAATARLLAWSHGEREFIDRLSDDGEIVPELITDDTASQASVREQPLLRWKALNVRISGSGVDGAPGVRLPAREGVQYDPASRRVVASSAAGVNSAFVEAAQ